MAWHAPETPVHAMTLQSTHIIILDGLLRGNPQWKKVHLMRAKRDGVHENLKMCDSVPHPPQTPLVCVS